MSSCNGAQPVRLLAFGLVLMLGFAAIELSTGWLVGLSALMADGLHMLAHSVHMAFALAVQAVANQMTPENRKRTVAYGGLAIAVFMLGLAGTVFYSIFAGHGQEHEHATHDGVVMMVVGLLSIGVHLYVSGKLFEGRCNPLVYGACIFTFSHAVLGIAIFTGGLFHAFFGWQDADAVLTVFVAVFMLWGALRITTHAIRNLRC